MVAWQVHGTKVFNGYVDPEKYAPIQVCVDERDRIQWKEPPACGAREVMSYKMEPGGLLWNQFADAALGGSRRRDCGERQYIAWRGALYGRVLRQ